MLMNSRMLHTSAWYCLTTCASAAGNRDRAGHAIASSAARAEGPARAEPAPGGGRRLTAAGHHSLACTTLGFLGETYRKVPPAQRSAPEPPAG